MKRHGNLWSSITTIENITQSHKLAKRNKGHYTAVKMVEKNPTLYLEQVQQMLLNKTFTTSDYQIEDRIEGGKMRRIFKLPYYPDRIVQHAVFAVVGPIVLKSLIRDTFQSLPGRGTSDARRRVQKLMNTDKPPKYALKVDIKQFYPSVNNDILLQKIADKIKCRDTLWVLTDIVNSHVGLPIGNLSSQYLGNLYLKDFDWWVKQSLQPIGYYRYADDLVLFSNSKMELRSFKKLMDDQLQGLGLEFKDTWQIFDVYRHGVDFVGYVFKPRATRIRKSIALNFKRRVAHYKNEIRESAFGALVSYRGWLMRANGKRLWRAHVDNRVIAAFDTLNSTNPLRRSL